MGAERRGRRGSWLDAGEFDRSLICVGCARTECNTRYGPLGNLEYRSSLGTYAYKDPAIPSAVSHVGGSSFEYDEHGRQILRDGVAIEYAANERVRSVNGPGVSASYSYDAGYEQVQRTSNGVTTTRVGDRYRRSEASFGTEATRDHFIFGPSGVVASLRFDANSPNGALIFHHADVLGSTDVITNEDAVVMQRQSYDVFGAPRLADDWMLPDAYTNPADWDLGYTGHREEQVAGLVDMRGRMYDARVGRFVSPDPLAGLEPTTQAFERYAYVRNRPLNFVDPSGFAPELQCDEERGECWGSGQEVWRGLAIETEPDSAPGVWNEIEYQVRAARGFASDPLGDMDLPAPVEYAGIAASTYLQMGWESGKAQLKVIGYGVGAMVAPVPVISYAVYDGLQMWDQVVRAPVETALGMTPIPDALSAIEAYRAGDYKMAVESGTRAVIGVALALALKRGLARRAAKGGGGGSAIFHRYDGKGMGPTGRHVTVELRDGAGTSLGEFHQTGVGKNASIQPVGSDIAGRSPLRSSPSVRVKNPQAGVDSVGDGYPAGPYKRGVNDCVSGACAVVSWAGGAVAPQWVRNALGM